MTKLHNFLHGDRGSVIVLVALVLPVLMLLVAGGVTGFSLYAAQRELQRAADQAALAGAAALPPLDPNVLVEEAPLPLPGTEPLYDVAGDPLAGLPTFRDVVPDPRAVSCAVGSSLLGTASAGIVNAFGKVLPDDPADPEGPVAHPDTVCDDDRVVPAMQTNPAAMTPADCTNELVGRVAEQAGDLDIDLLDPVLSPIQQTVDSVVEMPLNHVLPAAFTPRMQVGTRAHIQPPLLSLITGSDWGTMHARAVAYRRIKNAVVIPILPTQRLLIDTGLADPVEVMTDPVNLNRGLAAPQAGLIDAIDDADRRLDGLMSQFGLPCSRLLQNLRQDLRDLYDPPTGPAPSAKDIVDTAIASGESAASRAGLPAPDPDNPDSLAGEAFFLIGITVDENLKPILSSTYKPILDVAIAVMDKVSDGSVKCSEQKLVGGLLGGGTSTPETCYTATVVAAANAYGLFRAALVE